MPQSSILLVGYDDSLLTTRSAILQNAGFQVDCVRNGHQAASACSSKSYGAVLLCTSIPRSEADSLADTLHTACPGPSVLSLSTWDDIGLMEIRKPEFLLTIVRSVLNGPTAPLQSPESPMPGIQSS